MRRHLGPLLLLLVGRGIAAGVEYEVVRQLIGPYSYATGRLMPAADGSFYGTDTGGEFNRGSIFRLRPDGAGGFTHERLYSFHGPDGLRPLGLTPGPNSKLYGVTFYGGALGGGTAFVFDPVSGELLRLHNFIGNPDRLVLASDGQFYGVTTYGGINDQGTMFRMSPSGDVTLLHEFEPPDGSAPRGPLLQASDGFLYGTTENTIYRADFSGVVTTIHTFPPSGEARSPLGDLAEGADGYLYGVSYFGGTADVGAVFRCEKDGGDYSVLYSFLDISDGWYPNGGLLPAGDGTYLGTASGGPLEWGLVYRITPDGTKTNVHAFSDAGPTFGLAATADGDALGVTFRNPLGGTAFLLDLPAGDVVDLGELSRPLGPHSPSGEIVETSDGTLWGTAGGGASDLGTIYRLTGGDFLAHEFSGDDGANPGNLLVGADGNLYGVTASGGPNGLGTIFRFDGSGTLTTLHGFGGADGADPEGGLVEATDGNFYGTTAFGGVDGGGTLFRITSAGVHTKLHDFLAQAISEEPRGRLLQASDGYLYGTGYGFRGILFRSDLDGNVTTVHEFLIEEGENPPAGVIEADDGKLYGTCRTWGGGGLGTIFRFEPPDTYGVIHDFSGLGYPSTNVIQASDGRLYGMTTEDPTNPASFTSVFSVDLSGADFQTLHTFFQYGVLPAANFFQASDGMIYGAVKKAGEGGSGLIFRLDLIDGPAAPSISSVVPDSGTAAGGLAITIFGDHLSGATGTLGKVAFDSVSAFDVLTLFAVTPPLVPGTLNAVTVTSPDQQTATLPGAFFADFLDAPGDGPFHDQIVAIFRAGLTVGCGAGMYCTDSAVKRGQMAVFLLKAKHGADYMPPACQGVFPDVPCPSQFADWIEQLVTEGIAAGCGGGLYCPDDGVRRDQAAAFLLLTEHGAGYVPPACQGVFPDVPCPSLFADWVEQLVAEDISAGCGAGHYCPDSASTRGQMAAFLVRTFGL